MSGTAQVQEPTKLDPALIRVVIAVLVGGLAVVFDTTIVAVALHTLATDLHTSVATIQWVSTGYLLALGVTIPIAGWAQRRIGIKRLWLIALVIFGLGSVLCTFAWNAPSLIGFRVFQGIGGGIMLPLMTTLVMQAAGGAGLGRIMSVVSLPTVLGPVLGPVAGGLILDHWHWSWLFWVNVPFCAVGVVLAAVMLPKDGPVTRPKLDVVGVVLVSPGLVGVLYGLSRSSQAGGFGRADVLVPLIGGLVLILAFVGWSLRRKAALINVRLLDHWPLASSSLLLFLSGIALYGAMLLLPLYYQQLRGMSALGAGLMLIPQGLGTFVSRNIAGRLSDTMGARWLAVIGFGVVVVGTLPFAFAGGTTNEVVLLVTLFVRGLGLGAVTIPLMALAFRGLERADIPDASIISRIASQVGGAFGTAVLAVILQHALLGAHSVAAAATAFQVSFWWSVGFAAVAASLSLVLPGRPRQ
ncbi:MFS transporter [Microlunatus endophyticus]|uniref:MFS transporter n=1 Tax=Microlunatus endophyticus TaxID=1716077 RepID=A0A917W774_9ACTN|nr:DHA2 family efflux MFS transporter permease subunit [Microlunatus endophyticus]GGL71132.1 MFS transporter [Microlunatus endophyticus]